MLYIVYVRKAHSRAQSFAISNLSNLKTQAHRQEQRTRELWLYGTAHYDMTLQGNPFCPIRPRRTGQISSKGTTSTVFSHFSPRARHFCTLEPSAGRARRFCLRCFSALLFRRSYWQVSGPMYVWNRRRRARAGGTGGRESTSVGPTVDSYGPTPSPYSVQAVSFCYLLPCVTTTEWRMFEFRSELWTILLINHLKLIFWTPIRADLLEDALEVRGRKFHGSEPVALDAARS